MTRTFTLVAAAVLTLAMLSAGIAFAAATVQPDDHEVDGATPDAEVETGEAQDSDENLTGTSAERAADAALAATNGGTVLEVEAGDDPDSAYEVEVRTGDGSVAEVLLDEDFSVIGTVAGDDD